MASIPIPITNGISHLLALGSRPKTVPLRQLFLRANSVLSAARHLSQKPFRIAVVGSGPAGFYTALKVMSKISGSQVDMYESLPVPYGLVRFGVAPDHPEVKNCQQRFEAVASTPRFNFIGNISIGKDLPLESLRNHYDAILLAYGASEDKELNIPGEASLKGIYSARAFVGWYNGLPQYSHLDPNLQGEDAVIIGQGNVALDVARILLSDFDTLRKTDITEYALSKLASSQIKKVTIIGRRGPLQAAFTIKEARELMHLPSVAFVPLEANLLPKDISSLSRTPKRLMQLLLKESSTMESSASKSWGLRFLLSPLAFRSCFGDGGDLTHIDFLQNTLDSSEMLNLDAKTTHTDIIESVPTSLAFRSIGYKSLALPGFSEFGIPFDNLKGIIPNDACGRALNTSLGGLGKASGYIPGVYCSGWVKRGPSGVIASTMSDAFETAEAIAQDWHEGKPFLNGNGGNSHAQGWKSMQEEIQQRNLRRVDWDDWKKIDSAEQNRGGVVGKAREKISSVQEMLAVLD
ncbi:MAG: NADPH-adrenodoxin reductase [Trizodia sp. TS-e1964]|nr:MAG: NADPH-adrenodoxin reductase [Trizodia sp. TS-e1964]